MDKSQDKYDSTLIKKLDKALNDVEVIRKQHVNILSELHRLIDTVDSLPCIVDTCPNMIEEYTGPTFTLEED